jgi:hypothetical protein
MSAITVDAFDTTWTTAAGGLWTISATAGAAAPELGGLGMRIDAAAGAAGDPPPFAERHFAPALNLSGVDELRLWLRSSRIADGTPQRPFYLALEAATDPPAAGPPWHRLLPVQAPRTWEQHRLWLGDMPAALRQSVGFLRLRSLDVTHAFRADVDALLAVRPQALADVDAALLDRLDGVYVVPLVAGGTATVAAVVGGPSAGAVSAPHLVLTPWSVRALGRSGTSGDLVDNYVESGACVRPAPFSVQLEYRIDAVVDTREQRTTMLEGILADFMLRRLAVAGDALVPIPFEPAAEELAAVAAAGETPLFYRVVTTLEAGPRVMRDQARPFLAAGPLGEIATAEVVPV